MGWHFGTQDKMVPIFKIFPIHILKYEKTEKNCRMYVLTFNVFTKAFQGKPDIVCVVCEDKIWC